MDEDWTRQVELGRGYLAAPQLSRAEKSSNGQSDPKWALGDLLTNVPDHFIGKFASEVGASESELRRYRDVAERWPIECRVAASWSAHRDLKDVADRFEKIRPGMTVREAAEAAGKKPIDAKPMSRMSAEERAEQVIVLLGDKRVNEMVLSLMADRGAVRRQRRAAQLAADERSAEYKDAMKALRQAQTAKSPEVAFLEVIFKIQEAAEYVRAVCAAANDTESPVPLVPPQRKPELVTAIQSLEDIAWEALEALRDHPTSGPSGRTVIETDVATPRPVLLE